MSWSAIVAGTVAAIGLTLILLTLGSALGLASHLLKAGDPPFVENVTPTTAMVGPHNYKCNVSSCGSGHDNMDGIILVEP